MGIPWPPPLYVCSRHVLVLRGNGGAILSVFITTNLNPGPKSKTGKRPEVSWLEVSECLADIQVTADPSAKLFLAPQSHICPFLRPPSK